MSFLLFNSAYTLIRIFEYGSTERINSTYFRALFLCKKHHFCQSNFFDRREGNEEDKSVCLFHWTIHTRENSALSLVHISIKNP